MQLGLELRSFLDISSYNLTTAVSEEVSDTDLLYSSSISQAVLV